MDDAGHRVEVPLLHTPRLLLRGHRAGDLAACAAMWSDPAVVRYIGGRGFDEEEVWLRILRYVGHWAVMGFGYWAIEERATGRLVGEVGVSEAYRRIEPPWGEVMEVGWALASWAHGHGMATEAVQAVLAWVDAERAGNGRPVVCMIDPDNVASRRVAAKCGFVEYAQGRYKGEAVGLFEWR
jgi:RimJ/RimL family protein N-acetyltransferase